MYRPVSCLLQGRNSSADSTFFMNTRSGRKAPTLIQSVPSSSALIDRDALECRMASVLAKALCHRHDAAAAQAQPLLPRAWVKAPTSILSTSRTRKDWFRVMSFNYMVDRWCPRHACTPVRGIRVRIPRFTRDVTVSADDGNGVTLANVDANKGISNDRENNNGGTNNDDTTIDMSGAGAFVDYNTAIDTEIPPFLLPDSRRAHLTQLLRAYDPDLVCLNEVSKHTFDRVLWKYVRFLGYGMLYQSSRVTPFGSRSRNNTRARHGGCEHAHTPPTHASETGCDDDVGNVILFHKGRFVPILMPGCELSKHLHCVHIVAMRDRVTNMTLNLACVQLTAGDSPTAREVRQHEMTQILTLLDALTRDDTDRAHMTNLLCGDWNNVDECEPCVDTVRDRYFSTYDVVGGPRWTAHYFPDQAANGVYDARYLKDNLRQMYNTDPRRRRQEEMAHFVRDGSAMQRSLMQHMQEDDDRLRHDLTSLLDKKTTQDASLLTGHASPRPHSSQDAGDAMTLQDSVVVANEAVRRLQDYIFYHPAQLALHQVLDVPEDRYIHPQQLLPNSKLPSHHLPLMIDVSYNDTHPKQ